MTMNRHRIVRMMILPLLLIIMVSCATARQEQPIEQPVQQTSVEYRSLEGTIENIDKYGNATTTIDEATMTDAGYQLGDIITIAIGSQNIDAPYVGTYSDVDRGGFLVRPSSGKIALAMSYDNFAGKTGTDVGTAVTLTMADKAGYLNEYEIRHLVKSEERTEYASDPVFANFREVVAGKIARQRLYRGCNPVLDDARAPYAAKLVEQAKIKTVINLADSKESMAPNLPAAPYYQTLVEHGDVIALDMGIDFNDPAFIAKLKDGLLFMLDHEGPYYVHCNEGKDRAGMVAAVLEALMGATVKEIEDDYMVTYTNYFHVSKTDAKYPLIAKIITDMFVQMNNGQAVTDANIQKVAEDYLINVVGLTRTQVSQLKAKLS